MHWDDLKIIAAVGNQGSYAGAGKELNMDETTIARRLSRIQNALGITLFNAVDGKRKPTPYCLSVLSHINEMAIAATKITAIGDLSTGPLNNFRITSTASIAEEILAPRLGVFLASNPGLSLELRTSNENLNFSHWEADFAIRLGKPTKGNFTIRKLASLKFYLFQPTSLNKNQHCFVCTYPEELVDTTEMQELRNFGRPEPVRLRTGNVRIIHSIVKSRTGTGILPKHLAADLLDDPRITATPLKSTRDVWLLIQNHLKEDNAARLVIDWIVKQFRVV